MKKLVIMMVVIALGGIQAAKANMLAINEMKTELSNLTQKYADAKVNLARAKTETKSLKTAVKTLTKSIALATKSHEKKKAAEQASIESVGYSHKRNPYLADMSHAIGQASLSQEMLDSGAHY